MCGNYDSFLETLPQNPGRDPAEQSSWDILVTISMGAAGHRGWSRNFLTGKGRRGGLGWQPLSPAGASPFGHKQYFIGKQGVGGQRVTGKGDQVLPERRNAQNCLFRKESNLWSGITWGILRMKRRVQIPISADRA